MYPGECPQPMKEDYLLSGKLEPTSESYAVAKIAGSIMCQSYNRQYNTNFIRAIPADLYGPEDDFDTAISHMLASIIKKTVGFAGDLTFDTSKPDGAPRKFLDSSRIFKMGWVPKIGLEKGIENTCRWYLGHS